MSSKSTNNWEIFSTVKNTKKQQVKSATLPTKDPWVKLSKESQKESNSLLV